MAHPAVQNIAGLAGAASSHEEKACTAHEKACLLACTGYQSIRRCAASRRPRPSRAARRSSAAACAPACAARAPGSCAASPTAPAAAAGGAGRRAGRTERGLKELCWTGASILQLPQHSQASQPARQPASRPTLTPRPSTRSRSWLSSTGGTLLTKGMEPLATARMLGPTCAVRRTGHMVSGRGAAAW